MGQMNRKRKLFHKYKYIIYLIVLYFICPICHSLIYETKAQGHWIVTILFNKFSALGTLKNISFDIIFFNQVIYLKLNLVCKLKKKNKSWLTKANKQKYIIT